MKRFSARSPILERPFCILGLLAFGLVLTGCRTLTFYAQAAKGQYAILRTQNSVAELIAAPQTDPKLKARLELVQELRNFAEHKLKLPVDGHYRKYADLGRPFVVWNVQAAPEFSLEPKRWWYPFVGSLDYRGYFSEQGATQYAAWLERRKGCDVFVGGVQAYSTLGWFKDPVLNTFVFDPDSFLAELLFHEFGHQVAFARGDTGFNEAFATTVGHEGTLRWLESRPAAERERYKDCLRQNSEFVELIMRTRQKLETLYGDTRNEMGEIRAANRKRDIPGGDLRRQKREILDQLRQEYAALRKSWGGGNSQDSWFSQEVNNAQLNSVAAYYDLVPGFQELLAANGGDLSRFYAEAKRLARMSPENRHGRLRALARSGKERADRKAGSAATYAAQRTAVALPQICGDRWEDPETAPLSNEAASREDCR